MSKYKSRASCLSTLSLLIAFATSLMVAFYTQSPFGHVQNASAQDNVTATNQTVGVTGNQTMQSQNAAPFGNLTRADLDFLINNMNEAREFLHANDAAEAYVRLNRADSNLFAKLNEDPKLEQFQEIKSSIDNAKDALTQKDNAKALEDLNSASVVLFNVTQQLPTTEGEEEAEAEGAGE
jgi:hypothetical protein